MIIFTPYLEKIDDARHREKVANLLQWITETYPQLEKRVAWNQPMFTNNGTFIIGFSVSKNHLAVAPERAGILHFSDKIQAAGYNHTKMLMRIGWDQPINHDLLNEIIHYNCTEKEGYTSLWRKNDQ